MMFLGGKGKEGCKISTPPVLSSNPEIIREATKRANISTKRSRQGEQMKNHDHV